MTFQKESDFELALIKVLQEKGWEKEVLKNYTEKDLIKNWADILYDNNRDIDRLNNYPLTEGEMRQLIEEITSLRTPLKINGFINGKTVSIKRDNPDDKIHFGKEVSLKIYDRREIAAGQSRYQIVQQPVFATKSKMLNDRRGDLMLLINGMPVMHIELKKSGIPLSQAYNQIEKYTAEGVFTGLFALVQIFVAMTPEETVYFANPGPDGDFNKNYYFNWADFNNEKINNWAEVASSLLSIPMAHQLIGFYTVADNSDGILKVMRSYQYYAANAISNKVFKTKWGEGNQLGGYIWHTTGSGKTMTSFKSAQLIADSDDADKVVFLTDRIELGTQSLKAYRAFASENEDIQATENTHVLVSKLKSTDPADTLIVTSIQKMSNIKNEEGAPNSYDIQIIRNKRLVFIVDEAHRSTFGDMLITIKESFPEAIFFGFTGTPIFKENQKKNNYTSTVFGDELHRYSIADGIRDKNVLGFDPYKVMTFKDRDIRKAVALFMSKAGSEEEAMADLEKSKTYHQYMSGGQIPMAGYEDDQGIYIKGIEDNLPQSQYHTEQHQRAVVKDICENWTTLSHNYKFHAIFATSSIKEAIDYYRLIKEEGPELKISCLFDANIDNTGDFIYKEEGLVEIISDYNDRYGHDFSIPTHSAFKKDLAMRLAHKEAYIRIENDPEKQLDLLIVVDQMLTGFDSKWINTIYLDKVLEYENIIQAFSRTNRLFGPEKPFGTIRYYRKPHTMEENIKKAVKQYSGDRPLDLFVEKLPENIKKMNQAMEDIKSLFNNASIPDLSCLPKDITEKAKFASLFKEFNDYLEPAKVQGFKWSKKVYDFRAGNGSKTGPIEVSFNENTYNTLLQRYKELSSEPAPDVNGKPTEVAFDLEGYLTEIDTETIDAAYMNRSFEKYLKLLKQEGSAAESLEQAKDELHRTFASLSQEEQKYANSLLYDINSGDINIVSEDKTFRDYITEYGQRAVDDQIHRFANTMGLDESMLREMMSLHLTETNLGTFGRLEKLKDTVDISKAKAYFEGLEGKTMPLGKVNMKIDNLLRKFILSGGFEINKKKS